MSEIIPILTNGNGNSNEHVRTGVATCQNSKNSAKKVTIEIGNPISVIRENCGYWSSICEQKQIMTFTPFSIMTDFKHY